MARVVHFELPIDDAERAVTFYRNVLGWQIDKWEGPADYWLVTTGSESKPGINGALTLRSGGMTQTTNTVDVDDLDEAVQRVQENGGTVAMPRMPVSGVGWLAYCQDTEGNIFGMMQRDESAA